MEHFISTDKTKIDITAVHDYLCYRSYWAKGRSLDCVIESIENSLCFGLYSPEDKMLGFARVVTDKAVFAYIMDLFIFEEYQRKGLGTFLANHIFEHPDLQVRFFLLATQTAHSFYKKYGFSELDVPEKWMIRKDQNRC